MRCTTKNKHNQVNNVFDLFKIFLLERAHFMVKKKRMV